ncbi:uncharacterized protein EI90DRAFT_3085185, partial [Cantharellus anzutake]|uniref:uncharacterized protein n=1 Tax=Cantharellus anzutake TaxID=1750568 RepID=UPI001902E9D0
MPLFQTTIASLIFFSYFRTLLLTMSSCTPSNQNLAGNSSPQLIARKPILSLVNFFHYHCYCFCRSVAGLANKFLRNFIANPI